MSSAAANPTRPTTAGDLAIDARGLTRVYPARRVRGREASPPRRALDAVTVRIAPGTSVALLGPNGSGKSTLLKILSLADAPDSGTVSALGHRLWPAGERNGAGDYLAKLGMVFQNPGLDRLLTVRENLDLAATLAGVRDRDSTLVRLAGHLGLTARLDDRVGELSGGLARRVDLARALLGAPELLLMDEPTTGLDLAARGAFMDLVVSAESHAAATGRAMTVVFSTHLMDEAERAQRVVMMHAGRIVADGSPASLREQLGARLIRCPGGPRAEDAEDVLKACGQRPTRDTRGVVALVPHRDAGSVDTIVSRLSSRGVGFTCAPPTLGDAYLAATGATLDAPDGPTEEASP